MERALAESGPPLTVVAPAHFCDDPLGGYQDLLHGTLKLPRPAEHPLQQLDRADLGSFVQLISADPRPIAGRRFECASDAPTPAQMSQALSAALDRPIRFRETPASAIRSPGMADMWQFLRDGRYQADIPALHRDYAAIDWTSFAAWARRTFQP
jgi:uncharacterized protein YbjT (DUF2867 family)